MSQIVDVKTIVLPFTVVNGATINRYWNFNINNLTFQPNCAVIRNLVCNTNGITDYLFAISCPQLNPDFPIVSFSPNEGFQTSPNTHLKVTRPINNLQFSLQELSTSNSWGEVTDAHLNTPCGIAITIDFVKYA